MPVLARPTEPSALSFPKAFELPKAIHVEEEPFSVANDLLTPTFELRRQQLLKRYSGVVDGLYESMKSRAAGPR